MSSAGQQLVAGRIPGERIATEIVTSDSATFTTTETVVMTVEAPVFIGRTYSIDVFCKFSSTVDNDDVRAFIRQDSVSGTQVQTDSNELSTDSQEIDGQPFHLYGEYVADATENKTFVVTAERRVGTGDCRLQASVGKASYLYVNYISG